MGLLRLVFWQCFNQSDVEERARVRGWKEKVSTRRNWRGRVVLSIPASPPSIFGRFHNYCYPLSSLPSGHQRHELGDAESRKMLSSEITETSKCNPGLSTALGSHCASSQRPSAPLLRIACPPLRFLIHSQKLSQFHTIKIKSSCFPILLYYNVSS